MTNHYELRRGGFVWNGMLRNLNITALVLLAPCLALFSQCFGAVMQAALWAHKDGFLLSAAFIFHSA
jgi:hypothetical protein